MRKANILVLVITIASLLAIANITAPAKCIGMTTGFTFVLDEPYPLEHVYVGAGGPGGGGTYEDILLPGGVYGPGFDVPTGTSDFALEQTMSTDLMDVYAVIGTYVDTSTGETHLVLGTGEDLTGVYWADVLSSPFGLTWTSLIETLQTGTGLIYIIENLHTEGHMAPFGSSIQLYFFSEFGQLFEASVTANEFGNPEPPITTNIPPVSDPDGPYIGIIGGPLTFDGSGSYDPDGTISYEWDFGDTGTGTGATPTHTYASDGIYTVTLTVTDDDGATDTATTTATITPQQVIPEVPLGTIVASVAMIIALVAYIAMPRLRRKQQYVNL
jgi:hypothetical protein